MSVLNVMLALVFFFFSSRRRHTRLQGDWSSDVCSSDLRMVIRSPSSPSFDEERSRLLLLSDRLLRVPPSEEETPDGLVLEPPCLPEVGDGLRVKAAAPQHPDAVVRLASGAGEQPRSLRGGYGAARVQQLDALSDV